jgi:hypothetical protein
MHGTVVFNKQEYLLIPGEIQLVKNGFLFDISTHLYVYKLYTKAVLNVRSLSSAVHTDIE